MSNRRIPDSSMKLTKDPIAKHTLEHVQLANNAVGAAVYRYVHMGECHNLKIVEMKDIGFSAR